MLSCLEVFSISTSICIVHLQSLRKITPTCLCICTGDSEISRQTNCNRVEKIQTEAARIVTRLSIYASNDSIYKETGWETWNTRREVNKLLHDEIF
jgi:hypothetical protein